MLPDFLPAAEVLAKGVKHVACYVADAIVERRNAFSDDEDGDYLRCAGADALADTFCPPPHSVLNCRELWPCKTCGAPFGRMESESVDAAIPLMCPEHDVFLAKCARMPHSEGDEWSDDVTRGGTLGGDEPTVCYFCDRPTERRVDTGGVDEFVCERCARLAQYPAVTRLAADAEPLAPKPQGDGSPAGDCDIPPSPSAGHPPGFSSLREMFESAPLRTDPLKSQTDARKSDVCRHCANPIELVIDEKGWQLKPAGVWFHVGGEGRCRSTYASPQ